MRYPIAFLVFLAALLVSSGCAPATGASPAATASQPVSQTTALAADEPCPTSPITVVAVENFYGSILEQLGGQCVKVTSILADPSADPHEYQPTANDAKSYQAAQLIVENGLGYDDFSDKIVATLGRKPTVINIGEMLGLKVGDNPHVWYSPDYLNRITQAMTQSLKQANPSAGGYFDNQANAFVGSGLNSYRSSAQKLQTQFKGWPVGSTESIFGYMARDTGLNLISPPGLMVAVAEGNDPAARDLALFQDQITKRQIKVLVCNVQTNTHLTEQLKAMAVANNIPIVGISETMPPNAKSFQDWQTNQLEELIKALGGSGG